ncbi:MAG: DUF2914 domain-containing protein [Bacteroidota bacterium]
MNTISRLLLVACLILPAIGWSQIPAMDIEMELCESVVARRPLNPKKVFDPGDKAHCWLKVKNNYKGDYILVEWYQQDTLRHTQHLHLPIEDMQTHCYKTVNEGGKWRAEVKDRKGNLLKEMAFTVRKEKLQFFNDNDF